jgi:hypothetical protein
MSSNYEQMTNDELRHLIAKRLGMFVVILEGLSRIPGWSYQDEDGKWKSIPNWPENFYTAINDLSRDVFRCTFTDTKHSCRVVINPISAPDREYVCELEDIEPRYSPSGIRITNLSLMARVASIAWLRWQDAQEAE